MQRTRKMESLRMVYRAGSRLLLVAAVIGLVSSAGSSGWKPRAGSRSSRK